MTIEIMRSIVLIAALAAMAPLIAQLLARWIPIPTAVLEIVFGILAGPAVFGLLHDEQPLTSLSNCGLVLLFFLAGYEIEFERLRGGALTRAASSWGMSVVIALGIGGLLTLMLGDGLRGWLVLALVLTTTALGTILPMLRDSGILPTPLGANAMAVGAVGEFAPLVAISVLLSDRSPGRSLLVLGIFVLIAVFAAAVAMFPSSPRVIRLVSPTLTTSGQFIIRLTVLVVLLLVLIDERLHLDVVLGAFAAGIAIKLFLRPLNKHLTEVVELKLDSIAFGIFIPIFFIMTGVRFDLDALLSSGAAMALVPMGLVAFLLVRAVPVTYVFRRVLQGGQLQALGLYAATELPLVVVITDIGVENEWISPATAAGLVGAAMLSVLVFPLLAVRKAAPRRVIGEATEETAN